jgi:hypothetical protein
MKESEIEAAKRLMIGLPEAEQNRIREAVEEICIKHDVGGPAIYNVQLPEYEPALSRELQKSLIALRLAGELKLSLTELQLFCDVLAHDAAQLRQVRFAHDAGRISTAQLRALPVYAAFRRYLEEEPEFVMEGVLAALADRERQAEANPAPCPPVSHEVNGQKSADQPGEGSHDLTPELNRWLGFHTVLFAFAEDLSGSPCIGVDRERYIDESLPRLRREILRAVRNKELTLSEAMMERLARLAAQDAHAIRCLAQEHNAGKVSKQILKRSPLYQRYKTYFSPNADYRAILCHTIALAEFVDGRKAAGSN